jgi:hypothetical protein
MEHDVIVYQMGKVASTSFVAALNQLPGVTAYQSHFIGQDALCQILSNLLDPDINDHFAVHGEGQLVKNIQLTRLINRHRQGDAEKKLVFFTCSREPIDWFRAQVLQELNGYLPDFFKLSKMQRCEANEAQAIRVALDRIEDGIETVLRDRPGNVDEDAFQAYLWHPEKSPLAGDGEDRFLLRKHVATFFRPFRWFDDHIKTNLDIDVFSHARNGSVLEIAGPFFTLYVYRYEDIATIQDNLFKVLDAGPARMRKLNVSQDKRHAGIVHDDIAQWKLQPSIKDVYGSRYCRFFDYRSCARPAG